MESICEMQECLKCTTDIKIRHELCPICMAQQAMKGKWKIVIIWLLKDKRLRFSELKNLIPNITQAYLSSQLKSLEADKLVVRKSYNQVPPKVEYYLSDSGMKFSKILKSMGEWGLEYLTEHVFTDK